jgi:diadenosine tetraphosphate (Ap4A) HIT family hydrolase
VESYFDLESAEAEACHRLLIRMKDGIVSQDEAVTGFNVGVNVGRTAGQTVWHCHIHLVPRRKGDVARPRGGVRHVIPGKGCYRTDR